MGGLHILLAATALGLPAAAGGTGSDQALVLDLERGSFNTYVRWKTPSVVSSDGAVVPLLEPRRKDLKEEDRKPVPVVAGALPTKGWAQPGFDDTDWPRARGSVVVPHGAWGYGLPGSRGMIYVRGNQADWHLICLRGRFRIDDPEQVKGLTLTLRYHGGVVVYVNGRELCRGHMPQGPIDLEALGEPYPNEAYLRPDGLPYKKRDDRVFADRIKVRVRDLPPKGSPEGVVIPSSMLRKGLNVIAVEAHAAPVSQTGLLYTGKNVTPWPHVGVLEARLTALSTAGLVPSVGPSDGVQLWNCQPLESVEVWDYAHPSDEIRPIRLVGARNGTFSGKVVLSSKNSIRHLTACVSDLSLVGGAGTIAASAVRVRWAERASTAVTRNRPERFERLLDEFPAEIPPVQVSLRGRKVQPAPAAVVPVWVTIRVPADAAPGTYRGRLAVSAEDATPVTFTIPIELKVHDWRIPGPREFVSHHNLYQSPDTVAQYYKVPLWSERHFELMGKSLEVLSQVASKICVVSLIVRTPSLNNTQSMVRWIRKPGGGFDYDFTILEKYLDLYEQKAGKPAILQLNIWTHQGAKNPPPPCSVSLFDPATGKVEPLQQPPYGTPENEAFWRPVLTELRKRLQRRGWFDVAAVCYTSYCWRPPKEVVDVYRNIWPDGQWMDCSHGNPSKYAGTEGSMPVPYSEWVWGCGRLYDPDANPGKPQQYPSPWKKGAARIEVGIPRVGTGFIHVLRDSSALATYRTVTEAVMQSNVRGLGRVGGDFWPLPIGRGGRLEPLCDSYAAVGPVNNTVAMTSPGPDGAIFNERLEMFREGVQIAEAIIFLQRTLDTKRIDADLAARLTDLLDERARYYLRMRFPNNTCRLSFECSAWQERDDRLFALAAEAARAEKTR